MSKLDTILVQLRYQDGFFAEEAEEEMERSPELQQRKQQIIDLFLELIGEDDDESGYDLTAERPEEAPPVPDYDAVRHNELRAELRTKVKDL